MNSNKHYIMSRFFQTRVCEFKENLIIKEIIKTSIKIKHKKNILKVYKQ